MDILQERQKHLNKIQRRWDMVFGVVALLALLSTGLQGIQ